MASGHPERRSGNAALAAFAVEHLCVAGHEVRVCDLHAMKWKSLVKRMTYANTAWTGG